MLGALLRFEVEVVGDQVNCPRIFVCLFVCLSVARESHTKEEIC